MATPNETFALSVLTYLDRSMGLGLVKEDRPFGEALEKAQERGSGGERALLAMADQAWTLRSHLGPSFFGQLAAVDARTRGVVLLLFIEAWNDEITAAVENGNDEVEVSALAPEGEQR